MWDVSESTIKRWSDAGMLKCRKTVGGHRKFDLDDVFEFQNRSGLISKKASAGRAQSEANNDLDTLVAGHDFAELSRLYRESAIAGRHTVTSKMLSRAYSRGLSLATISEEIIKPALHEIGDMWRAGKVRVFEEHLATFATTQAINELHSITIRKPRSDKLALVGCSDGELHQIAATLVRSLLEAEGWSVIYLGPLTPLFSFADTIGKLKPELVCVSATMADDLERAARDYETLRRAASKHGAKIIMGGLALEDERVRARFRGALYAATMHDLLSILERCEKGLEE